jgi:hypothetical protein
MDSEARSAAEKELFDAWQETMREAKLAIERP